MKQLPPATLESLAKHWLLMNRHGAYSEKAQEFVATRSTDALFQEQARLAAQVHQEAQELRTKQTEKYGRDWTKQMMLPMATILAMMTILVATYYWAVIDSRTTTVYLSGAIAGVAAVVMFGAFVWGGVRQRKLHERY